MFIKDAVDITQGLIPKLYLLEVYPSLSNLVKSPKLLVCGDNQYCELGTGDNTNYSIPVQTISGGTDWKYVAANWTHATAIKTNGTLWAWGFNNLGQIGAGGTDTYSIPIQIASQVGSSSWNNISCGGTHTAAVNDDGSLWVWGYNGHGELGDYTNLNRSLPVQTIFGGNDWTQVSCGYYYTAAIKNDSSLWLWGFNNSGQLGIDVIQNTSGGMQTLRVSSPIQTQASGNNWAQVSCGDSHVGAIKNDGTLWMWGANDSGQLGTDSYSAFIPSPVQTIMGGTDWKQVSCYTNHTAAIKNDGTLWMWGLNFAGQLGDGTIDNKSSPVQTTAAGTNWFRLATGPGYQTVAIKNDGTLWAWGDDAYGQLGTTTTNISLPIQIFGGGYSWKYAACGYYATYAIMDADPNF